MKTDGWKFFSRKYATTQAQKQADLKKAAAEMKAKEEAAAAAKAEAAAKAAKVCVLVFLLCMYVLSGR